MGGCVVGRAVVGGFIIKALFFLRLSINEGKVNQFSVNDQVNVVAPVGFWRESNVGASRFTLIDNDKVNVVAPGSFWRESNAGASRFTLIDNDKVNFVAPAGFWRESNAGASRFTLIDNE
ncbi:MAG: hypothetical protein H6632_09445 [Anaerolineales bacterium]|nr:hypothetical protein [Anaerolineales bacterium]